MVMVQEAPIASVPVPVAQVPPADPVGLETGWGVPPPNVNAPPVNAALPVFVTVTLMPLLVVVVAQLPKFKVVGDTVALLITGMPVPLRETGAPLTVPELVLMVSEPV